MTRHFSADPSRDVADVETHRYSPFLGHGDHFWQSYQENKVQKIRHTIHHTILKGRMTI
jgi:hypothetical protein